MKRVCIILALLLGLCACGQVVPEETSVITTAPTTEQETMVHGTLPAKEAEDYASVIQAYSSFIQNARNGKYDGTEGLHAYEKDIEAFLKDLNIPDELSDEVKGSFQEGFMFYDPIQMGCAVYDINKDGTSELIIFEDDSCLWIKAIFTFKNGKPILLGAYWSRSCIVIDENGMLYHQASGGASYNWSYAYMLPPGGTELKLIEERGAGTIAPMGEGCYYQKDGKAVWLSVDEYNALETVWDVDLDRYYFMNDGVKTPIRIGCYYLQEGKKIWLREEENDPWNDYYYIDGVKAPIMGNTEEYYRIKDGIKKLFSLDDYCKLEPLSTYSIVCPNVPQLDLIFIPIAP